MDTCKSVSGRRYDQVRVDSSLISSCITGASVHGLQNRFLHWSIPVLMDCMGTNLREKFLAAC